MPPSLLPLPFPRPSTVTNRLPSTPQVVYNLGLCICLFDILRVSEGQIGHGSGSAHVNVEFRLIVFRPFKGEVLTGRISSSSPHGINVRTDFFDEIFIPHAYLFEGSTFDVKENVWIWNNDGNEFFMDKNETIRFRVEEEAFEDQLPIPPHLQDDRMEVERKPPYKIIVGRVLSLGSLHGDADYGSRLPRSRQEWVWLHGGQKKEMKKTGKRQSNNLCPNLKNSSLFLPTLQTIIMHYLLPPSR